MENVSLKDTLLKKYKYDNGRPVLRAKSFIKNVITPFFEELGFLKDNLVTELSCSRMSENNEVLIKINAFINIHKSVTVTLDYGYSSMNIKCRRFIFDTRDNSFKRMSEEYLVFFYFSCDSDRRRSKRN